MLRGIHDTQGNLRYILDCGDPVGIVNLQTKMWSAVVRCDLQREGLEKTGGGEDVLCNVYFSTMRAATDKRSSPVERVDQVAKG